MSDKEAECFEYGWLIGKKLSQFMSLTDLNYHEDAGRILNQANNLLNTSIKKGCIDENSQLHKNIDNALDDNRIKFEYEIREE